MIYHVHFTLNPDRNTVAILPKGFKRTDIILESDTQSQTDEMTELQIIVVLGVTLTCILWSVLMYIAHKKDVQAKKIQDERDAIKRNALLNRLIEGKRE